MTETLQVRDLTPEVLEPALRRTLGIRAFLSGVGDVGKHKLVVAGATQMDFIDDDRSMERTVSFTQLPDILSLEALKTDRGYSIKLPKQDPAKLLESRYRGLLARHENEVLKHSFRQLVHISEIDLAMRPIAEILSRVHNYGTFSPPATRRGASTARATRLAKYTRFLTDLGFVQPEGSGFVAGPSLPRGFADDTPEEVIFEEFMGRVLQSGHQFLTEVLHLTMIKPFLRIENSYYWPAHQVGGDLHMKRERFGRVFSDYYGTRPPKFEAHVQSIIRKGGLVAAAGQLGGAPEILEPLLKVRFEDWASSVSLN